ncbi:MAG: M24 family metallopeptidase [Planctomycetota bacterium]
MSPAVFATTHGLCNQSPDSPSAGSSSAGTPVAPHGVVKLVAGYPDRYPNVLHRIRLLLGDMAAFIDATGVGKGTAMIVRNIELPRARKSGQADKVFSPEDLIPPDSGNLSGDRNTAVAQAVAEWCRQQQIRQVSGDTMLPLLFTDVLTRAGVEVVCDRELGGADRRAKDDWEVEQLQVAQAATENSIRHAFEILAKSTLGGDDGVTLQYEGATLTSDRLRGEILSHLLRAGYTHPSAPIVACGPQGSDCHHRGEGDLRAGEPIILDVFPRSIDSQYNGDCTRTLVRPLPGNEGIPKTIVEMHEAVVAAKRAAFDATRTGALASDLHAAATRVLSSRGYRIGNPDETELTANPDLIFMPHGTGHGIGLETHEPPLLDALNPIPLVNGDALTIEPGLYCPRIGGLRIEDLVIVRDGGLDNLNTMLSEDLWWGD